MEITPPNPAPDGQPTAPIMLAIRLRRSARNLVISSRRDVTFDGRTEFRLLGPNGAGKSTLIGC